MNFFQQDKAYQAGDIVYVLYRNPHTQDVVNIQEAAVVRNPDNPNQLAIFLYETYYPLTDEIAIFQSEDEAKQAYDYFFGSEEETQFF